jgi:DNA repair exonuclease SbcCD ATPase subunit
MEQFQGLTAEMYRAIVTIVDDRMREIRVTRQEYNRLVRAHARTEERVSRLEEAITKLMEVQARAEEESAARWASIEAALNRLAEAQARTEQAQARTEEAQARTAEELQRYREESEVRWASIEAALARLAEAQARTEEAQARTEAQIRALAEAQARTEEAQARTAEELRRYREESEVRWANIEAALAQLAEAQARTEAQVWRLTDREGELRGRMLEFSYYQKAGSYFGPFLRRPRAVLPVEIEEQVEKHLLQEEFRELLAVDLLVSGYPRYRPEAPQVWLVVEVSATVDRNDVERARRRAGILRKAGLRAIPAVAGEDATIGAMEMAEAHKVLMLQDGRALFWEEALTEALSEEPSGGAR